MSEKQNQQPKTVLDKAARDKVEKWLHEKLESQIKCPICGRTKWIAGDKLSMSPTISASGAIDLVNVVPSFTMNCKHCAYIISFNALPMGLLQQAIDTGTITTNESDQVLKAGDDA